MKKKEKIIGILGGMGPYATLDFFKTILDLVPAKKDWDYPRILIDNNVKIPSRTRALLYDEEKPTSYIIQSINNLTKIGADFAVVPCNSAHYFYEEVTPYIKIPWLNMIQIAAETVQKKHKKKPLILGGYITIKKRLYSKYISDAVYLSQSENDLVNTLIEEIKLTSHLSLSSRKKLEKLVEKNRKGIDCIILACTELPIVYKDKKICDITTIDANLEYAKETIKFAEA